MTRADSKRRTASRDPAGENRETAPANRELPVDDPLRELSPTAARLLEAAKTILARDGFAHLTFDEIGAESGETGSLIRYHFGSKAGLIEALLDSIVHQGSADLLETLRTAMPGNERRHALLDVHRRWIADPGEYITFYAILSHALFEESLRHKYRDLFKWYAQLESWALADDESAGARRAAEPLATLIVAATDGLGLQKQADPDFDASQVFDVLQEMLKLYRQRHAGDTMEGA